MVQYILISCCILVAGNPDHAPDLTGIKCIVSGKPVHANYVQKYKDGIVYFDCNASRLKFATEKSKYVAKANHQLVVTSQYVQAYCPSQLNNAIIESTSSFQIAGVKIKTCCPNCQNLMASKGSMEQQIVSIFGDKTFDRIFVPNPIPRNGKRDLKADADSASKR